MPRHLLFLFISVHDFSQKKNGQKLHFDSTKMINWSEKFFFLKRIILFFSQFCYCVYHHVLNTNITDTLQNDSSWSNCFYIHCFLERKKSGKEVYLYVFFYYVEYRFIYFFIYFDRIFSHHFSGNCTFD